MNFEGIYQDYFHDVYLYLRALSRDEKIAEEMAQETFFKALNAIENDTGPSDIRAWLFTIAKHTYFTYYKKQKKQILSDVMEETNTGVEITDHLMNKEDAFTVHQFLHSMKEPYKEVFTLRTFGELPFKKIAELFGKSEGWARVTFHRARKEIMEYMEEMNDERS
ncbi:RNA polymerase sigma factor [Jeotgalibacillus proteolyticus]|uniref:RNA polymerase sigma factor n=1 Tax=Jeotgalibacillus proteolyticus TaxID=2082395 RepID=UPI003CF8BE97